MIDSREPSQTGTDGHSHHFRRGKWVWWVFAAIALFYLLNAEALTMRIAMVDPLRPIDLVVGIVTIALVIEAVRRALGMAR